MIECLYCQKDVHARLTNGKEIYPHRPDLAYKKFYICDICKNYVGCHPNSERPLGFIPSKEIRKARLHIHRLLDPLWQNKLIKRGKAYKILSDKMGYQYHNGELRSIEEGRKAYKIVAELHKQLHGT